MAGFLKGRKLTDLCWDLYVIAIVAFFVWIEVAIQIEFAKARAISREIDEIHDRIEARLHGQKDQ